MKDLFFHVPTRIIFGNDVLNRLGVVVGSLGKRVFLVTDSILTENGVTAMMQEYLGAKGIDAITFDEIGTHSTSAAVDAGMHLAQAGKCQAVIGAGGIRALSTAKCVAAMKPVNDELDDFLSETKLGPKRLPYVAVPTTNRDPFMLTNECLIVDGRNRASRILRAEGHFADAVLIDPVLSLTLSRKYSIATLLDTFLCAIEGYFSRKSTFISDSLFLKAVSTVISLLPELAENPESREHRLKACQAGICVALGLSMGRQGVGSAIAYGLSGKYMIPKSWTAAIMIPHVLEYGASACPGKVARMGPIVGELMEDLSDTEAATRVVEIMRSRIGYQHIPMRLRDFGVTREGLAEVAEIVQSFDMLGDLASAVTFEDIYSILEQAL